LTSYHADNKNTKKETRSQMKMKTAAEIYFQKNGGDNIGVYVPLFSKYNSVSQITTLTAVFIVMTAVWCIASYCFVNHPLVASRIRHVGNIILPFVLIGLGIYILSESFLFT
jgi:cadmium resistance protein CadD (predicted permease)